MLKTKRQKLIILTLLFLFLLTASSASAQGGLENPLGNIKNLDELLAQIIRVFLGFTALIATIMVIWGGVTLMTSSGNPEKVKKGKDTLVWATIGLALTFLSWAIIRFVIETLGASIGG